MLKRVAHSLGLVEHTDKYSRKKSQLRGSKASPDFSSRSRDFVVRITHAGGQQELYKHAVPASKLMKKYPGMRVALPEVFKTPHQSVLWPEERLLPGHKYILISSKDVEKLKRKHPEQGKTKEPNGVVAKETLDTKSRSPSGHKPKANGKMKVPNGAAGQEILDAKTRHPSGHKDKENGKMKEPNGVAGQEMLETRTTPPPSGCQSQENSEVKEANGLGEEIVNTKMDRSLGGGVVEESFCSAKDFYVSKEKWTRCTRRKGIKGKKPFVPPLPKARPYRSLGWHPSLPTVKELSP